jgi:TatA/E family protein of Tat protein translocase
MPDIGAPELIIILVAVIIIFGPGKLPELGRSLGSSIREMRNSLNPGNDEPPAAGSTEPTTTATTITTTATITPAPPAASAPAVPPTTSPMPPMPSAPPAEPPTKDVA